MGHVGKEPCDCMTIKHLLASLAPWSQSCDEGIAGAQQGSVKGVLLFFNEPFMGVQTAELSLLMGCTPRCQHFVLSLWPTLLTSLH